LVWFYSFNLQAGSEHHEVSIFSWDDGENLTKESNLPNVIGLYTTTAFIYKSEIYLVHLFTEEDPEGLIKWNPKTREYSVVSTTGNVPNYGTDPVICLHKENLYYMSRMNHELFKLNMDTLNWTFIDYDLNQRPFPYSKSLSFFKNSLFVIGKTLEGSASLKDEYDPEMQDEESDMEEPEMEDEESKKKLHLRIQSSMGFLKRRFGDDQDAITKFLENEKEETLIVKVSQ
jgi:hypothetical protein